MLSKALNTFHVNQFTTRLFTAFIFLFCNTFHAFSQSDSIRLQLPLSKSALSDQVKYKARDSIRFNLKKKKIFLYGDAKVDYQNISLNAEQIVIDWETSLVNATGVFDSTGKRIGSPVFSQGGQTFDAFEIDYNFRTEKGRIKKVSTQEGQGYLQGETVFRDANKNFLVNGGRYTTCNLPDHQHFYIRANKIKVIPNDKIITGPANLVIEDVPTPLVVPFGFFPNTTRNKSGILVPTYGDSPELGLFLQQGGYFFNISPNFQAALTGTIYSRGSWGLQGLTNYNYRYKFDGVFDVRYSKILRGDPELLGSLVNRDFFITWRHNQSPKARPNSQFSANVQAGTNNFNALNSFNTQNIVTNTFQSNITYTKTFPRSPFSLSLNAGHTQNTQTRVVSITAPQLQLNMNRIFPFKSKNTVGNPKWFEKIGITYTLNGRNTITQPDTLLGRGGIVRQMSNGLQHTIPIATSFQMGKYFTVSPGMNILGRGYFSRLEKRFDPDKGNFVNDTIQGFWAPHEVNFNTSVSTRVFSMLYLGKNIIRHVVVPTLGFSYQPDYSTRRFGFFGPDNAPASYSPYQIGIFGEPSVGRRGVVSLGLNSNLEAKFKSKRDTTGTGFKKVTLLDAFNINSGYNLAADSLQFQPVVFNLRTRLFKKLDVVFSQNWDVYAINPLNNQRINTFQYEVNGNLLRTVTRNLALTTNLASAAPKRKSALSPEQKAILDRERGMYVDFNVPWTLNATFNLAFNPLSTVKSSAILNINGDVNLTDKWKIGFVSGYDFNQKALSFTSFDIYRDLHCWEMRINYIPFGFQRSYRLTINVKASVLQDLKLNRRRAWFDQQNL